MLFSQSLSLALLVCAILPSCPRALRTRRISPTQSTPHLPDRQSNSSDQVESPDMGVLCVPWGLGRCLLCRLLAILRNGGGTVRTIATGASCARRSVPPSRPRLQRLVFVTTPWIVGVALYREDTCRQRSKPYSSGEARTAGVPRLEPKSFSQPDPGGFHAARPGLEGGGAPVQTRA